MLIYLSAVLVAFFWALKSIREKKIILRRTPLDLPIGIFFLSQVISTIISIDRQTSLLGYYGRFNGGLLSLIAYLLLFYGFVTFFNWEHVRKLLGISLFSSLVVILWGLPGKLGFDLSCYVFTGQLSNNCWTDQFRPQERMFSTLGQPNWLGAYLVINFFIALYFLIEEQLKKSIENSRKKLLLMIYLFLNTSAILFTRSRSSLIALFSCFFVFCVGTLLIKKIKVKKNLYAKKILLPLIGIFAITVILFKTGISTMDRFLTVPSGKPISKQSQVANISQPALSSEVTESLDIRKIVWKGAIDLGLKYPLFGTGVETFAYSYYLVRPVAHNLTSEWDYLYNKAHNEYLNYLATTGFFGLASYLFYITFFFVWVMRKLHVKRHEDVFFILSMICAWISILITNFFGFSTTTINLFFYLIPATLLILSTIGRPKNLPFVQKEITLNKRLSYIIASLVAFFFVGWLFLYYVADMEYASATAYSQSGDYQKAAELLNKALQIHYEHVYEDKLSYALANLAFLAAYQKDQKTAVDLVKLSDLHNVRSIEASPRNPLYWKTRGKDYYLFYQITLDKKDLEKAVEALIQDRKISPTDPKIPYTLAVFYSLISDDEQNTSVKLDYQNKALVYSMEATQLKSDFRDGYFLQGQLYKKYGNKSRAVEAFQQVLKINKTDKEAEAELQDLEKNR